jgi:hypothetical protein
MWHTVLRLRGRLRNVVGYTRRASIPALILRIGVAWIFALIFASGPAHAAEVLQIRYAITGGDLSWFSCAGASCSPTADPPGESFNPQGGSYRVRFPGATGTYTVPNSDGTPASIVGIVIEGTRSLGGTPATIRIPHVIAGNGQLDRTAFWFPGQHHYTVTAGFGCASCSSYSALSSHGAKRATAIHANFRFTRVTSTNSFFPPQVFTTWSGFLDLQGTQSTGGLRFAFHLDAQEISRGFVDEGPVRVPGVEPAIASLVLGLGIFTAVRRLRR